jgi:hypothetical protein
MIATAKKTRTLVSGDSKVEIAMWVITKHGWEYYLEEPKDGIAFGYVMGVEGEWGTVNIEELKLFQAVKATGKDLMNISPPLSDHTNMEWED